MADSEREYLRISKRCDFSHTSRYPPIFKTTLSLTISVRKKLWETKQGKTGTAEFPYLTIWYIRYCSWFTTF